MLGPGPCGAAPGGTAHEYAAHEYAKNAIARSLKRCFRRKSINLTDVFIKAADDFKAHLK
jgi:hypothetical protein